MELSFEILARMLVVLILAWCLTACGEKGKKCRTREEAYYECVADEVAKNPFLDINVHEQYCESLYLGEGCY